MDSGPCGWSPADSTAAVLCLPSTACFHHRQQGAEGTPTVSGLPMACLDCRTHVALPAVSLIVAEQAKAGARREVGRGAEWVNLWLRR